MNYCILNGKKSTMVKGLMIQSLPSIVKPLMRTNIETIDGRDGDIITKLGYSAYDKEMSIGLFGDYDLSEVAQYFDSEGEVIFSNELDKKYRFQILDAINFERLGRFRQATIKFHVQPFKYPTTDFEVSQELNTAGGTSIIRVENFGNVPSKPKIRLDCSGVTTYDTVLIKDNSVTPKWLMYVNLTGSTSPYITIDTEKMTAYPNESSRNVSMNRYVQCDYNKVNIPTNENGAFIISISGKARYATISNITRWI